MQYLADFNIKLSYTSFSNPNMPLLVDSFLCFFFETRNVILSIRGESHKSRLPMENTSYYAHPYLADMQIYPKAIFFNVQ